ncbi:MAG TPA: sensor histidine kinase [Segeticoccus sp.]|uniref:sensor histidine kinase n=1 Tax=Segeticoccus sp. TaxID=2706531 RepID=UPI002D807912|nr:sensor histidine kinase [Segeticoccus sp.]HET8599175.1 sensor histidine kinase [Segeticoccus sp.]
MRSCGGRRFLPAFVPIAVVVAIIQVFGSFGSARYHHGHVNGLGVALLLIGPLAIATLQKWRFAPLAVALAATITYVALDYPVGPVFLSPVVALLLEGVRTRRERWAAARREQAIARERADSEQRMEIARELHDVIGHSLSVINVQAGVALHLLEDHPENARPALTTIKSVSHEALTEVRAVLETLRDPQSATRAPAPRLTDVPALVAQTSGDPVDWQLEVSGTRGAVPAAVDSAAYRVVQEAMTNVRRHAHAGHGHIALRYAERQVTVQVTDDGQGLGNAADSRGTGLAGMRARVEALGGSFTVRDRQPHGVEVSAQIRWHAKESTDD